VKEVNASEMPAALEPAINLMLILLFIDWTPLLEGIIFHKQNFVLSLGSIESFYFLCYFSPLKFLK